MEYKSPNVKEKAYNCPHCGVFAMQIWSDLMTSFEGRGGWSSQSFMNVGKCDHCNLLTIWVNDKLIYPESSTLPPPNNDLNEDIKKDYNESASIVNKSPKASAALLRLAIQKLCEQLGEKGKDLNQDIANLVKKGLHPQIQKSLDIVRVIGNESVHPGQINLDDNKEIALKLFELVNIIARDMITGPKEIDKIYSSLPENKLKGIKKRDLKKK